MGHRGRSCFLFGSCVSLLLHPMAACDRDTPFVASPCETDRECADGDLCNGIERCVEGDCVIEAEAVCDDGAVCLPGGFCAEPFEAVPDGTAGRCLPPTTPAVAFVTTNHALPVRMPDSSRGVEVAIGIGDGVRGPWQRIDGDSVDLKRIVDVVSRDGHEIEVHLRHVSPAHGCADVTFSGRYALVDVTSSDGGTLSATTSALLDGGRDSRRIDAHDPRIVGWASEWVDYSPGARVDGVWSDPTLALGPSVFDVYDVLSLGEGGSVTVALPWLLADGPGDDFAVFENAVPDDFIELAFVEVSSDGISFARFDAISLTASPVTSYGRVDARLLDGLAGPAPLGVGVTFDLARLAHHPAVVDGRVDPDAIAFVRLVDIIGDGSARDSLGLSIFDPFPVSGSGGFDLESIAVLQP